MKRYVALARVSSREQEREGFSLDVQEDALRGYAERQDGEIVKLYRVAETASKRDERRTFKLLVEYARQHAPELDGVLFYKVDRAARNLFDYLELERLEQEQGLRSIFVTQKTGDGPAGRLHRRTLANMAAFQVELQSELVKEGMARRVQNGLFPGHAPYGYRNVRVDGRGLVEVDPEKGPYIRRIFELYAYHNHTLDSLLDALEEEGIFYSKSRGRFPRSKLHDMLRDRSYIGEVRWHDEWHPGTHEPLVERSLFERVQVLLGDATYASHESVYGSGLVECAHCGRPICVEVKTRQLKSGPKEYRYYRCTRYTADGHPRVRVTEADLDEQVMEMFQGLKIEDAKVRRWIAKALRAKTKKTQRAGVRRHERTERQLVEVRRQKDRLLDMRLLDDIDRETFAAKHRELRDREAKLTLQIEAQGRQQSEHADLAAKVFELSQTLAETWDTADVAEKRQVLEILCLNWRLDGVSLCPVWRKPFDVLAEGLVLQDGRGKDLRHPGASSNRGFRAPGASRPHLPYPTFPP
ncbi:MAG: recombinase family protein, partial [Candidatus Brocadiia bacterium]